MLNHAWPKVAPTTVPASDACIGAAVGPKLADAARRLRVVHVITKSNWGGAQKHVYDLATALPHDRFEVVVAFGGTGERGAGPGMLSERLAQAGVRTIHLRHFARDMCAKDDLRTLAELLDLFRKERPDVIHLHSSKAGGLGALAGLLAGVRTRIFTVHGLAVHEERPWLARRLIVLSSWLTFLFATRAIVLNTLDHQAVQRWPLVAHKLRLIRNGIIAPRFLGAEQARAQLAALSDRPALTRVPIWIGTISELHPNKGIEYMLDACAELTADGYDFAFHVIGDEGGARQDLDERICRLKLQTRVILHGPVPDAARYMPAFDVFTLSSVKEGLPYVLLEAALAERAIVATRVGGAPEIIDADSGQLVDPKNAQALAEAISSLLTSPAARRELGKAARNVVEGRFSRERMLASTLSLYQGEEPVSSPRRPVAAAPLSPAPTTSAARHQSARPPTHHHDARPNG